MKRLVMLLALLTVLPGCILSGRGNLNGSQAIEFERGNSRPADGYEFDNGVKLDQRRN
jgi:hypothetical protein